jgi:hypothetical protein
MFGNFNATRNASAAGPAPKKLAKAISLMNPTIRLIAVRLPICRKAQPSEVGFVSFDPFG